MNILAYLAISVAGLIAGATVGGVCGLMLGWLLSLGYHRHGPSDPGDAPVYVSIGLMMVGACLGAILGLAIGVIFCMRFARRRKILKTVGVTSP